MDYYLDGLLLFFFFVIFHSLAILNDMKAFKVSSLIIFF